MTTPLIQQLRANRDAERRAATALLDRAESQGGSSLSASDQATFAEHMSAIEEIDARIAELSALEERNVEADRSRARFSGGLIRSAADAQIRGLLTGEVRHLDVDLAGVHREQRDLSVGTTTAGGHTVPTSFVRTLYAHLVESSAIRQTNVTVFSTESGEDLQVPKTTSHSSATLTAENVALTESDPAFGQTTLGAYKYGVRIDVTNELLTDSGIDLTGYLAEQAGRALGNASGAHFITGDGSGKPSGVVPATTEGVEGGTGVTGAFTADELIDLYFSVIPQYRSRGYWLMSDTALAAVRKLKDADNNYLFVPNNSGGPDLLMGRPIVTDPNVATPAVSAKSVLFGDFSQYGIRDVRAVRFERSEDFAFDRDVTVFRALLRTDGKLIGDASAIKHFVGGAS